MTEKEKQCMENFRVLLAVMTEKEKDNLLCFTEGMATMATQLHAQIGS